MCNQFDDRYFPRPGGRAVDQDTGVIAPPVPPKGNEATVPTGNAEINPYVKPPVVTSKPLKGRPTQPPLRLPSAGYLMAIRS